MITREKRSSTRVMYGIVGKMQGNLSSPFLKERVTRFALRRREM